MGEVETRETVSMERAFQGLRDRAKRRCVSVKNRLFLLQYQPDVLSWSWLGELTDAIEAAEKVQLSVSPLPRVVIRLATDPPPYRNLLDVLWYNVPAADLKLEVFYGCLVVGQEHLAEARLEPEFVDLLQAMQEE